MGLCGPLSWQQPLQGTTAGDRPAPARSSRAGRSHGTPRYGTQHLADSHTLLTATMVTAMSSCSMEAGSSSCAQHFPQPDTPHRPCLADDELHGSTNNTCGIANNIPYATSACWSPCCCLGVFPPAPTLSQPVVELAWVVPCHALHMLSTAHHAQQCGLVTAEGCWLQQHRSGLQPADGRTHSVAC